MNETDDAILEFMAALGTPGGEPAAVSPAVVYRNIVEIRGTLDKSKSTISRRLKHFLEPAGLVQRHANDAYYMITDKGRDYLSGELDAADLPETLN